MKNICCLILVLTTLFGCSSEDEFESVNPKLIIGKWKLKSIYSGFGDELTLNECETKSYYQFFEDNSFIGDIYKKTHLGCELDSEEKMNAFFEIINGELQLNWSEIRLHSKHDIRKIFFIQFPNSNTLEFYRYGIDGDVNEYPTEVWSRIE